MVAEATTCGLDPCMVHSLSSLPTSEPNLHDRKRSALQLVVKDIVFSWSPFRQQSLNHGVPSRVLNFGSMPSAASGTSARARE